MSVKDKLLKEKNLYLHHSKREESKPILKPFIILFLLICLSTGIFTLILVFLPPIPIYRVDTVGYASDIYVSGNYAYVADYTSGLAIIDISDPKKPGTPVYVNTYGIAQDVYVEGNYAYVANGNAGLAVINVSNPLNFTLTAIIDIDGYASGIFVSENHAFVADNANGLVIINISNPTLPEVIDKIELYGSTLGVYNSGNFSYVAGVYEFDISCYGHIGMKIFDVENPSNSSFVREICLRGYATDSFISDDNLFIATLNNGLVIVNISDPFNPGIPIYIEIVGTALDVFVYEKVAYIADYEEGLAIIDIADPMEITQVLYLYTKGDTMGVYVTGNHAYIADGLKGLIIIDVSNISDDIMRFNFVQSVLLNGLIYSALSGMVFELLLLFKWGRNKRLKDSKKQLLVEEKIREFIKYNLYGSFYSVLFGIFSSLTVEAGMFLSEVKRFDFGINILNSMTLGILIVIPLGLIIVGNLIDASLLASLMVTVGGLTGMMIGWTLGDNFGELYENATWLGTGLVIGLIVGALVSILANIILIKSNDLKNKQNKRRKLIEEFDEMKMKAEKAYNSNEFEDYYLLELFSIEKLIELIYFIYYKAIMPETSKTNDQIRNFMQIFELELVVIDEFFRFFNVREKFYRNQLKIERNQVEKLSKFSSKFTKKLKSLILKLGYKLGEINKD